jgi:hypothetical protein
MAALGIVILFQLLPESMDLNPNDRISFWIKILPSAKSLHADGVLLKTLPTPRNSLICQELKQLLQCQGISKGSRVDGAVDLLLTLLD